MVLMVLMVSNDPKLITMLKLLICLRHRFQKYLWVNMYSPYLENYLYKHQRSYYEFILTTAVFTSCAICQANVTLYALTGVCISCVYLSYVEIILPNWSNYHKRSFTEF